LVAREALGRRGAYQPTKNAAERTADIMHQALKRGPDAIAALRHFVTQLSPVEERKLRDLLARMPHP
jgi:predicted transcriptional regulator